MPGSTPSEPLTFDNRDRGNDAKRRATSEEALKMERRACPGGVGLSPTLRATRLMRLVLVAQLVVTMRSVGLLPETTIPFRPSSWPSARRLPGGRVQFPGFTSPDAPCPRHSFAAAMRSVELLRLLSGKLRVRIPSLVHDRRSSTGRTPNVLDAPCSRCSILMTMRRYELLRWFDSTLARHMGQPCWQGHAWTAEFSSSPSGRCAVHGILRETTTG